LGLGRWPFVPTEKAGKLGPKSYFEGCAKLVAWSFALTPGTDMATPLASMLDDAVELLSRPYSVHASVIIPPGGAQGVIVKAPNGKTYSVILRPLLPGESE